MRLDQVVHERPNLVEGKLGGGVRIEHRGVIDVLTFACQSGFDSKALDI